MALVLFLYGQGIVFGPSGNLISGGMFRLSVLPDRRQAGRVAGLKPRTVAPASANFCVVNLIEFCRGSRSIRLKLFFPI